MPSLTSMFCGSTRRVDDTPARSRRSKKKGRDNPYAGRGLDKFAAVLVELEAKKEKIMAQVGPQHEVRFVQSSTNSNAWRPIVVRGKGSEVGDSPVLVRSPARSSDAKWLTPTMSPKMRKVVEADKEEGEDVLIKCFPWTDHKELRDQWRGSYYGYVALVLVLICVVMFGKPFAIVCTSIWWYLLPAFKGENTYNYGRKSMKRKEYGRRMSGKKVNSGEQMISKGSPLRIICSS